tara:strand:- start:368 stop:805 length:438 start_codon:yes stop_codon:yes gene_type:complete
MVKEETPYLTWDTCDVVDSRVDDLLEQGEFESEDAARDDACSDADIYVWAWDDLVEDLTELMKEINPDELEWHVEAEGLGWQRRSGHRTFSATDGTELLRGILPDTECTFQIYKEEGQLRLVNSHHDAMGEVYIISPQKENSYEE